MNSYYIIVGNIFKNLSDQKLILTVEELIAKLTNNTIHYGFLNLQQGISENEVYQIKDILKKKNLLTAFTVSSYFDEATRCQNELTHKSQSFNTLISEPFTTTEQSYSSLLMIDSRCAEMSDHVTGKHIPMMVLTEAARQMVMAVTEKFFIPEKLRGHLSFVANRTELKFTQFVFPFRTEIHCNILKQKVLAGNNLLNTINVYFLQNQKFVSEIKFDSTVFSKQFLIDKENRMAKIAIQEQFNNMYQLPLVANHD